MSKSCTDDYRALDVRQVNRAGRLTRDATGFHCYGVLTVLEGFGDFIKHAHVISLSKWMRPTCYSNNILWFCTARKIFLE